MDSRLQTINKFKKLQKDVTKSLKSIGAATDALSDTFDGLQEAISLADSEEFPEEADVVVDLPDEVLEAMKHFDRGMTKLNEAIEVMELFWSLLY